MITLDNVWISSGDHLETICDDADGSGKPAWRVVSHACCTGSVPRVSGGRSFRYVWVSGTMSIRTTVTDGLAPPGANTVDCGPSGDHPETVRSPVSYRDWADPHYHVRNLDDRPRPQLLVVLGCVYFRGFS